jgi:LysM repeat protein
MKWFRTTSVVLLSAVLIVLLLAQPFALYAQAPGQNLLTDGDFETPNWRSQAGINELVIAPGWRAWYVDIGRIQPYVKKPSNCDTSDPACYWMRPEFNSADFDAFPNRVHSGFHAQKYFSYGRMHEAGLYQQVIGVQPGATLRFSIFMQAWQCSKPEDCGENGSRSDAPAEMHLRVGIDPYGGTDPFSANIVWSPEKPAFDHWTPFSVLAQAKGGAVTVFTHSRAEWDWPRTNNDVYLDDASLTVVGEGTSQPGATSAATQLTGTPEPTITPANTPTPRVDGAIVHIVGPGDTLYGISLQYGVSYDDLLQLNNLSRTSILELGQQIVVKAGTGAVISPGATPATTLALPQATPTVAPPTPTVAPIFTRTPAPPPAAPTDAAQLAQPAPGRANTSSILPAWLAIAIAIVVIAILVIIQRRR